MIVRIKGVGQIFDFESGEMKDTLQLETQDGQQITVPTNQETVQRLIQMRVSNGHRDAPGPQQAPPPIPEHRIDEDTGGAVFGGDFEGGDEDLDQMFDQDSGPGLKMAEVPSEPPGLGDLGPTHHQKQSMAKIDDRSGVPTRTLPGNLVDEKGNPVTATAPDTMMDDDEDDPGEQI